MADFGARLRGDREQGKPVLADELRHRILLQQQRPTGLECQHAHAAGGAHFERARAHARDVEAEIMLLLRDLHGDRAAVLAGEFTAAGEGLGSVELLIDRPHARVTTVHPQGGYEVWLTDGADVRGYNAVTNTTTRRPHRAAPTGLDDRGLPQNSRVPTDMGPLPGKGWATSFVRPGSFCSSVLAGAVLGAVHETSLAGRVALTVEAAAPRAVALDGDRADFRFRVTFDRLTGVLLGVEEFRSAHLVRSALCTSFEVDASIPASAFDLELPPDVVTLY